MKHNTLVTFKWFDGNFKLVGKWNGSFVFANMNKMDECNIYSEDEVQELIDDGKLIIMKEGV